MSGSRSQRVIPLAALVAALVLACTDQSAPSASTQTSAPAPTPTDPPRSTITFVSTPIDLGGTQWMEDQAVEFGVSLAADIYALDQETAFLLGGLRVPAGTLRSTLLRSDDGGQRWQEVMEPVPGSEVITLSFVEGGHGWALVLWTVEGAGPISVYGTTDNGLTWQKLADVPKWQWYGYPVRMTFSDETHGQIDVLYDAGLPSTNRIAFLTTLDGGLTWQETGSLPLGSPREDAYGTAVAPYSTDRRAPVTGRDGSLWQLDTNRTPPQLFVTRRSSSGSAPTVYVIPTHFAYSGGIISLPE